VKNFLNSKTILLLLVLFLVGLSSVSAQSNYKVIEIVVEGNKVASRSLILGVSSIQLGEPLTPTVTTESIKGLYRLGIFSDVSIEVEETAGGLKVYVVVKELPRLVNLEFEGTKKIDVRDIKEQINLGVGGYLSDFLIQQKITEIKQMYADKGYFQASVKYEQAINDDSTEVDLKFIIDEKSKVKVKKVIINGNERVSDKLLIKKMRNKKRGFLKSSDFVQSKFQEDQDKVIEELRKRGFIDAYMISDSLSIDTITNLMTIFLEVYEGPRYYFGEVNFEANEVLPTTYLDSKIEYKSGSVFDMEKYEKSLQELYSAYYDVGHLHIQIFDERATREDSIIDIKYNINEGLPSHINLVNIVGNNKTKDRVIRRELKFYPGQIFTREKMIRSIRDVMALNYFTNVNPVPLNLPDGDVDIELTVEEKQTGEFSAGAGYNSQDKLVGNVGMGIPNFRGMGQRLSFSTEFGSRRNSFSLSFTEPWLFGRPTLMGTDLYSIKRRWFSDYTETRQGISFKVGRRLRWPDTYFRVIAAYRLERDRYEDFDDNFKALNSFKVAHFYHDQDENGAPIYDTITDSLGNDSLIARYNTDVDLREPFNGSILNWEDQWNSASRFSLTIRRDSKNLPEFATKGSDISYTFSKTGGFLGGYWNYTKHNFSAAKFIPLFWKFSLAARIQFGAIISPSGTSDSLILLSDRFTPGGTAYDGIVRGYEDGSLTPDSLVIFADTTYFYSDSASIADAIQDGQFDPNLADTIIVDVDTITTRVRGNFTLVTNIELQIPIMEQQIYGLFFLDAGNSWLRFKDMDWSLDKPFLYGGYGVGVRIAVPGIGTIGVDFARPMKPFGQFGDPNYQDISWKTHFQIGSTFK
jgi:outer membrane protein insertion porin family